MAKNKKRKKNLKTYHKNKKRKKITQKNKNIKKNIEPKKEHQQEKKKQNSKKLKTIKNKNKKNSNKDIIKKGQLKKENKKLKIVRSIFIIIFLIGIIYSITNTIFWYIDNNKIKDIQEEVFDKVEIEEVPETNEEVALINRPKNDNDIYWKYKDVTMINVDINKLKKENNDTVAWLQVLGTNINYPVVQSTDNNYYLKHDYLKRKNAGGWVFLDYRNDINNLGKNNIIYGHNRYNNYIFGTLKNVLNKTWFNNKDNHIIKISTSAYNYVFQVFSIYTIPNETYYIKTNFKDDEVYQEFLDTITKKSIYDFNTEINNDTKILTLSTCHKSNERLVVHAKLIKMSSKN